MHDLAVIGLGVMGLATAAAAARRGLSVIGFDARVAGHEMGSSHGRTRMTRTSYFEGEFYVPMLREAHRLWDRMGDEAGERIFHPVGALYAGPGGGTVIPGVRAASKAHDIPVENVSAAEARKRFPFLDLREGWTALFEPGAGYIDPLPAMRHFTRTAESHGARLLRPATVTELQARDSHVRITAGRKTYEAGSIVLAAGGWNAGLARLLGINVGITPRRTLLNWYGADTARLGPDKLPVTLFEYEGGDILYFFPKTEAEPGLKAAFHSRFADAGLDDAEGALSPAMQAEIRDLLRDCLPEEDFAPLMQKSCVYSMTDDRHFMLGALPGHERVFMAGGFSGHGFKFAPVIGEIMANLVETGKSPWDLSPFRIDRFQA